MEKKISYRGSTRKYNLLEKYDMRQFGNHCVTVEPSDIGTPADVNHILRFWDINKSKYLYKLLDERLIISKPISFTKSTDELYEDLVTFMDDNRAFLRVFSSALREALSLGYPRYDTDETICDFFYRTVNLNLRADMLCENIISFFDDKPYGNSVTVIINGTKVTMSEGQKIMKLVGNIARALDMQEQFERFRIAHSMVFNQKRVNGNLCLSIHPLDFATASDNNNNWNSCMSWLTNGCYRLGTVEMMNSPMVICAYLTGKNELEDVGGNNWNSKKWRAWVLVDETAIFVNKQYPYTNDQIATFVVEWVRELAKKNLGWNFMEPYKQDLKDFNISYHTNFMYNDTTCFDETIVAVSDKYDFEQEYSINYSGPANCMWCGDEIEPGDIGADSLLCWKCSKHTLCHCCGDPLDDEDIYWGSDDNPYCVDCFSNEFSNCSRCGDTYYNEDVIQIHLPHYDDIFYKYRRYPFIYFSDNDIYLCPNCLDELNLHPNALIKKNDCYELNPFIESNRDIYIRLRSIRSEPNKAEKECYGEMWDTYVEKSTFEMTLD